MKFVALISGGKDSFFNTQHCLSQGHELVALGNLYPQTQQDEIDSFMFQTVGHDIIDYYKECLGVPLYRQAIHGGSTNQNLEYEKTENDEIEDLYQLLSTIKSHHPDLEAVSCGAILSHYQRTRVENVCDRLGLTSLTYLWQRNQYDLMQEMCQSNLDARIIKVAAIGLNSSHLGKSISELFPHLVKLNSLYEVHICGEGGEFETVVLDSPFFKYKKLKIVEKEVVDHSSDDVSYLRLKVELVDKEVNEEFIPLDSPPLLEESFEDIYEALESTNINHLSISDKLEASEESSFIPRTGIVSTPTKLYVSNLVSANPKSSLQDQATEIFDQLEHHLHENNLTLNDIQHITLLLSNMSNFASINQIYSSRFKNLYLPPSRVCVQTEITTAVQLSCVTLKDQKPSSKAGIHIRSRSYWAPQNIGPYSQSIIENRLNYKLASLSGQIPLIPSTMELSSESTTFNSVFSLQHLHRVKTLVQVTKLASVICFLKQEKDLSIAKSTWEEYTSDIQAPEISKSLIIAQVTELPRLADIEWSGSSYENIVGMYDDDSEDEAEEETADKSGLFESFEVSNMIEIGKGAIKFGTFHTNDIKKVTSLIQERETDHIQVYASNGSLSELYSLSKTNIEIVPVVRSFDYKGTPYKFSILIKIEN